MQRDPATPGLIGPNIGLVMEKYDNHAEQMVWADCEALKEGENGMSEKRATTLTGDKREPR